MLSNGIHIGRRYGVRLSGGGFSPTFLLRDDFTTDAAAPLASPRTAEPGPGTWMIGGAGAGAVYISGGALYVPASSGTVNVVSATFGGQAGLACVLEIFGRNAYCSGGVFTNAARWSSIGSANMIANRIIGFPVASNKWYQYAQILTGMDRLIHAYKGNEYSDWHIATVSVHSTASGFFVGHRGDVSGTQVTRKNRVLVLDEFAGSASVATQRLAGARAAGDTFTHTANCSIGFVVTTRPSADQIELRFRIQDASNYWQVTVDSSGNLDLDEVVAGTPTQRGTAAGAVTNGKYLVVHCTGSRIFVEDSNSQVIRINYTSATNFATATAGELEVLGTGGAVSDIVAWPRTLTGTAAAVLDAAVA